MFKGALVFLMSLFSCASFALAGPIEDARETFLAGDYDAAIAMALLTNSPEGLTLAAEVLSAKVMLGYVDDPNDSAKQARKWAEKAVKTAPDSREARIQYALAYGFETRTSSPFRAWRKKLPKKTRRAIDYCRKHYPADPRADALLGAWHLGIIRAAGEKNGKKWFEASEDAGMKYYESALKAAPQDIIIASNYAVTLLGLDTDRHLARATEVMQAIAVMPTNNTVETDVKSRIEKLNSKTGDLEALKAAVTKMLEG